MLALGLVAFIIAAVVWQALLMAAAVAGLALVLQQLADPSPLFWAVPWEALKLMMSTKARANHLWLHHTEDLARETLGWSAKVDGFATRDGFVLMGSRLDAAEVRSCSDLSLRILCQHSVQRKVSRGCKASRFLLALWVVSIGLLVLDSRRGLDIAGALLVVVSGSAAGYGLAGPAEKLLLRSIGRPKSGEDETRSDGLEVESFWVPTFLWLKGGRAFRVRQTPKEKIPKRLGDKE